MAACDLPQYLLLPERKVSFLLFAPTLPSESHCSEGILEDRAPSEQLSQTKINVFKGTCKIREKPKRPTDILRNKMI